MHGATLIPSEIPSKRACAAGAGIKAPLGQTFGTATTEIGRDARGFPDLLSSAEFRAGDLDVGGKGLEPLTLGV